MMLLDCVGSSLIIAEWKKHAAKSDAACHLVYVDVVKSAFPFEYGSIFYIATVGFHLVDVFLASCSLEGVLTSPTLDTRVAACSATGPLQTNCAPSPSQ